MLCKIFRFVARISKLSFGNPQDENFVGLAGLHTDNLGLYGTRPELFYNYHISTKVELQANVIYVLTLFTTARLVVKKSVCIQDNF